MSVQRILSLVVAGAYVALVCWRAQPPTFKGVLGVILMSCLGIAFPLACIWFAEEMGDYFGPLPGPAINRRSPDWMVSLGGWMLLSLQVVVVGFTLQY